MPRLPVGALLSPSRARLRARARDDVADFYAAQAAQPGGRLCPGAATTSMPACRAPSRQYIPGNPGVTVQNMPAPVPARHHYLLHAAPKDGTVVRHFARTMPLMSVVGDNPNVQFDARKADLARIAVELRQRRLHPVVRPDVRSNRSRTRGTPAVRAGAQRHRRREPAPTCRSCLRDALGSYQDGQRLSRQQRDVLRRREQGSRQGAWRTFPRCARRGRIGWPATAAHAAAIRPATRHQDFPRADGRELARNDAERALIGDHGAALRP